MLALAETTKWETRAELSRFFTAINILSYEKYSMKFKLGKKEVISRKEMRSTMCSCILEKSGRSTSFYFTIVVYNF